MSIQIVPPILGQDNSFWPVLNGAPTYSTSGLRTEGGSASMVVTTTGSPRNGGVTHVAGKRVLVESFWVRRRNAPLAIATIYQATNASGNCVIRMNTSGQLLALVTGGTASAATTALTQDVWYRVGVRTTVSGGTATVDWWVNGAKQASATHAQADADLTQSLIGLINSTTVTLEFMDWVISYTSTDAPLGEYVTKIIAPTGVGTHNIGTGTFTKTGSVAVTGGDTTSYQEIDEFPPSATDWVAQTGIGTSGTQYLEYTLPDSLFTRPPAAACAIAHFQGAGASGSFTFQVRVRSGSNETADITTGVTKTDTSPRGATLQLANDPGGGSWSDALWNGVTLRFGYSTDVTPNPQLNALGVICAYSNLRNHSGMVI